MILAQVQAQSQSGTSPAFLGLLVVGLVALVGLGSAILAMFFTRREHEAHKEEVDRRVSAVEATVESLGKQITECGQAIHDSERRLAAAGEHRAEALHNRFNDVLAGLSKVQGRLDAMKD